MIHFVGFCLPKNKSHGTPLDIPMMRRLFFSVGFSNRNRYLAQQYKSNKKLVVLTVNKINHLQLRVRIGVKIGKNPKLLDSYVNDKRNVKVGINKLTKRKSDKKAIFPNSKMYNETQKIWKSWA